MRANWFRGSYKTDGIIYDYSCAFTRDSGGIDWEATVSGDAMCSATGRIREARSDCEVLHVISACVEHEIGLQAQKRTAASTPAAREKDLSSVRQ